jgi:hypothetical protein
VPARPVKYSVVPVGFGVTSNALVWLAARTGVGMVFVPPVPAPPAPDDEVLVDVLVDAPPVPLELVLVFDVLVFDVLDALGPPPAFTPVELLVELFVDACVLVVDPPVPPPPQPPDAEPTTANAVIALSGPARCQNDLFLAFVILPPDVSRNFSARRPVDLLLGEPTEMQVEAGASTRERVPRLHFYTVGAARKR